MTGLAAVGNSLAVFRERQIYVIAGAGPDNTGAGGTFQEPEVISDEIGCVEPRSIVRIPAGVMFQSAKGIYLLASNYSLAYVGADVEAYNAETITAAVALTDRHEVRLTLASDSNKRALSRNCS